MKDKVTVVVPVYNVEKYLIRCIDSILFQTYTNLEIILVDDGSTDNSGKICDEYGKKDNRITTIHKSNGGLSDARNFGIEKASGKYITFIDSDDWIEKDTIEKALDNFIEDIDIVVYGIAINSDDGVVKNKVPKIKGKLNNMEALIYLNSFYNIDVSVCNKVFLKTLFDDIRFPKGKLSEDFYVIFKLMGKSNNVKVIPDVKYHYFQRKGSITKNKNINLDYIYAAEEQLKYINKKFPNLSYVGNTAVAFSKLIIYTIKENNNIAFDKNKELKDIRKYTKYIIKNKYLPLIRKVQFICFSFFNNIYFGIMHTKEKIK